MVLGSTLPTIDPQLRGIIRRINFWKRFFRTFPGYKEEFLKAVASSGLSKYTPCGSFRVSLQDIGWHCLPDGWIRHVKGISLQWTEQSRKYCNKVMSRAWTYHVMEKVSHRKGVDMATYDFSFMNKVLQTKTAQEQAILCSYFAGIHFTFDVISKFSETASVNCPHCDAPDSREHRLVFCKALEKYRTPFNAAFQWLANQPRAATHYSLCPYNDHWIQIKASQQGDRIPFAIPTCDDKTFPVFTDGSADSQQQWEYTTAGSAVVILDSIMGEQCIKCFQNPLVGPNQNSYRAEVQAILISLNELWLPCIFTDSLAAVTIFQRMIFQAARGSTQFYCEDWDLWGKKFGSTLS